MYLVTTALLQFLSLLRITYLLYYRLGQNTPIKQHQIILYKKLSIDHMFFHKMTYSCRSMLSCFTYAVNMTRSS